MGTNERARELSDIPTVVQQTVAALDQRGLHAERAKFDERVAALEAAGTLLSGMTWRVIDETHESCALRLEVAHDGVWLYVKRTDWEAAKAMQSSRVADLLVDIGRSPAIHDQRRFELLAGMRRLGYRWSSTDLTWRRRPGVVVRRVAAGLIGAGLAVGVVVGVFRVPTTEAAAARVSYLAAAVSVLAAVLPFIVKRIRGNP